YYILSMRAEYAEQFRALESLGRVGFDDVYHACILLRRGDETQQIVKQLEDFLVADPADRRSRLALAEELRRLERPVEAEEVLSCLPASDSHAQALRARLALDRGEIAATQQILTAAPAGIPDLALLRGRLALAARDREAAVREYRIAVSAYPDTRD